MANYSETYYPGFNFNFSQLVGCVQIGSCVGATGTSQTCDNGEVGGFATPTGRSYLRMGSFSSPRVASRSAYSPFNFKYAESISYVVRAGNDRNGGERPNNGGEDFYVAVSDGGFNILAYSNGSSGSNAYGGYDGYWDSWRTVSYGIPSNLRQSNGYITFASDASSSPEFDGVGGVGQSNVQNAGDTYGLASFTVNFQIPAPAATLTTNRTAVTVGLDTITLTWAVGDAEFTPTLTDFPTFPNNQLSEGNVGSGSGTRVPSTTTGLLSTTGTKTYTLSVSNRIASTSASVNIEVVGIPTASISINGVSSPNTAEVSVGDSVTISWSSTWGATRTIDGGVGSVAASGSTTRVITQSGLNTFTFTVTNLAGYTVTAQAFVIAYPIPTIDSLTYDPDPTLQDTEFTLFWNTSNATGSVSITGIGSNLPQDGSQQLTATVDQGSAGGYPGAPTYGNGYRDYTITACNPVNRCVTQTLRVFVTPQSPVASLTITPTTINFGDTVTLTWSNIYTTSASINQGIGAVTPPLSGTTTFTVTGNPNDFLDNSDKIFTLTAQGYGGVDTNSYSIQVLIDSVPAAWLFNNKTGALRSTVYYASSNSTVPL